MPKTRKQTFSQRQKKQIETRNAQRAFLYGRTNFKENSDDKNYKIMETIDSNVVYNSIILGDFSQFSNEFPLPHTQCTAMAIVALAYADMKIVTSWDGSDLNIILRAGQIYYQNSFSHTLSKIPNYDGTYLEVLHALKILNIGSEVVEVCAESTQCYGGPYIENNVVEAFRKFEQCQFHYCVITYLNFSFGIVRHEVNRTSHYAFIDSHGRSNNGKRNGSKSAVLLFDNLENFLIFFTMEYPYIAKSTTNHDLLSNFIMVPLHFINHNEEGILNINITSIFKNFSLIENSLCTRIISGNFAQNDIRFNEHYSDRQCTVNSVVFLAHVLLLKEDFRSEDVDSILVLGNNMYTSVLKKATRNNSLFYLNEIEEEINVNISRLGFGNCNVSCQPLVDKEYSDNFISIKQTIEEFFQNHCNGILHSSSMSIAFHKSEKECLIFDSRARSVEGFEQKNGNAHIFFFSSIQLILEFLCRLGFKKSDTFSLMPFYVTSKQHVDTADRKENNNSITVVPIIDNETISPVYDKEINYVWDSSDDIPLINLKNSIKPKKKVKRQNKIKKKINVIKRKETNRLKMQNFRLNMSDEKLKDVKKKNAEAKKRKRENESDDQRQKRLKTETEKYKIRRNKENIKWPEKIPKRLKRKCILNFIDKMSKKEISQKTCCVCIIELILTLTVDNYNFLKLSIMHYFKLQNQYFIW